MSAVEQRPARMDGDRARTRERLLGAVAAMRDTLAAQCAAEERAATLSAISVEALQQGGILAMKLPLVLGGSEADPVTQFEVIEAVTAANSAAGWCCMVGATSVGMPGAFLPQAGCAEMFAGGRIPRGAIVVMPAGEARPVAGGYRLRGRWSFASGVRHAEWVVANARLLRAPGAPPEIWCCVLPARDVIIHDNWQVAGLRGTGSCDISVDDGFVPAHLAWDFRAAQVQRGGALYRLGLPAFVANEHAAFALGVARAALDALLATASRARGYVPGARSLAERGSVQRMLGRAELALGAARALAIARNEEAWQTVAAGGALTPRQQAELRALAGWCTEVAADVVTQAFRYAGGSAIYEANLMQRCLRDIQVAAQHLIVSDSAYENLGQFMLGVADADPMR